MVFEEIGSALVLGGDPVQTPGLLLQIPEGPDPVDQMQKLVGKAAQGVGLKYQQQKLDEYL